MTCDRAEDRALVLSQGLFGVPAGRERRDRDDRAAEEPIRDDPDGRAGR